MCLIINSGGRLVGVGVDLFYPSGRFKKSWAICLVIPWMVGELFPTRGRTSNSNSILLLLI